MSRPALESVPCCPDRYDRTWKVTVSRRGSETVHASLLVPAGNMEEAARAMLAHCATPGLDLEVTAVERLPRGVITRSTATKRGKAA